MGDPGEDDRGRAETTWVVNEAATNWPDRHPRARLALTTLYYLAVIITLLLMYGRGNFETPEFVYQEF